ncbi:MAG: hypothetical protein CMJ31_02250 [Phycisphaerae bacterium]|nr:hypothetical protein [Phycisphaerae bacterium]
MFIKITDKRGRERWVNPLYVKSLTPKAGGSETDIEVSNWGMKFRVGQPPEEIAMELNAALLNIQSAAVAVATEEQIAQQRAAAAAAAG